MESLKIKVDLKRKTAESIILQQGYTYPVEVQIFDNGKEYDCTGAIPQIHFGKSNGKFTIKTKDITIEGNKVSFKLDGTMTNISGSGKLQIVLSRNDEIFGSWVIYSNVFENAIQDSDKEDSNVIDVLTELKNDIAIAKPLSDSLERDIPKATPLVNTMKEQIPQARELVDEMKSAIEEGGTVDRRELGEFLKGYDGKEHKVLSERLNADYDGLQQQINDSSYLPYEGTSIKADNSYYGLTKDLSVKGRTLQNLFNGGKEAVDLSLTTATKSCVNSTNVNMYKPNTVYTVIINVKQNTIVDDSATIYKSSSHLGIFPNATVKPSAIPIGIYMYKLTTVDDFTGLTNAFRMPIIPNGATEGVFEVDKVLILEGDHTNTPLSELPFGEGIYSVGEAEVTSDGKYPVGVKSCGKNLAKELVEENYVKEGAGDISYTDGKVILTDTSGWASCRLFSKYTIPVKKDTIYYSSVVSDVGNVNGRLIQTLDSNGNVINANVSVLTSLNGIDFYPLTFNSTYNAFVGDANKFYFKFSEQVKKVKIGFRPTTSQGDKPCTFSELTFVEGASNLTYEPYQESSLEYLLDEPLRSLPNGVADVVKQSQLIKRVGEYTITGNEPIVYSSQYNTEHTACFYLTTTIKAKSPLNVLSNNFLAKGVIETQYDGESIQVGGSAEPYERIYIKVNKSKLSTLDIQGFKQWLQANPTTVYYELAEPIITQLEPQQLFSFKGVTHISSPNTLQPILNTRIASNVPKVVQALRSENEALNGELKVANERSINADLDMLAMNWETDFRVCELEFAIFTARDIDTPPIVMDVTNKMLTKYEQAKILIENGRYNKETMEKQLLVYLNRGYITVEEYNELIELMQPKEGEKVPTLR